MNVKLFPQPQDLIEKHDERDRQKESKQCNESRPSIDTIYIILHIIQSAESLLTERGYRSKYFEGNQREKRTDNIFQQVIVNGEREKFFSFAS